MNEIDAMRLLAEANPVEAHDLASVELPVRFARRGPHRRLGLAVVLAAVAAGALVGVFAFNGSDSANRRVHGDIPRLEEPAHIGGPTGANGANGPARPIDPTTAYYRDGPTGANGPTRTNSGSGTAGPASLADAREALGAPLVLPDVPPVDSSGIGKIVKDCGESFRSTACDVGIGFPEQRVWIYYQPAGQWRGSSDPLAVYKNSVKYNPPARIVYLSGTPALVSPGGGPNGGNVEFLIDGVRVRIWAVVPVPSGGPSLQAIAQSIVDRSR